jgi:hypothetical protein
VVAEEEGTIIEDDHTTGDAHMTEEIETEDAETTEDDLIVIEEGTMEDEIEAMEENEGAAEKDMEMEDANEEEGTIVAKEERTRKIAMSTNAQASVGTGRGQASNAGLIIANLTRRRIVGRRVKDPRMDEH